MRGTVPDAFKKLPCAYASIIMFVVEEDNELQNPDTTATTVR